MDLVNYALGIQVKLIKIHFLIKLMLGNKIIVIVLFIVQKDFNVKIKNQLIGGFINLSQKTREHFHFSLLMSSKKTDYKHLEI